MEGDKFSIKKVKGFEGEARVPGDKSITHRALFLGSLARGKTRIKGFLKAADCQATLKAFEMMGIRWWEENNSLILEGKGLYGLKEPEDILNAGNSGTTLRLLLGVLSCEPFFSVLSGDDSLKKRPMGRVVLPLRSMGARIWGREGGEYAPLALIGSKLSPKSIELPVSSAQVKSSLLLAGLFNEGPTKVIEPNPSRDHTERMFKSCGAQIEKEGSKTIIYGGNELEGTDIEVPKDISAAAFFMVGALLSPNSQLLLKGIGINPTRTGVIDILRRMGGKIELTNEREVSGEPVADIVVKSSRLKGVTVEGEMIPRAIDELPIIAVACSLAEGESIIRDARELRYKESDRISAMVTGLKKMGARIEEKEDGMLIQGVEELKGASLSGYGDHRIVMSFIIAGCLASKETSVDHISSIDISFPGFLDVLKEITLLS